MISPWHASTKLTRRSRRVAAGLAAGITLALASPAPSGGDGDPVPPSEPAATRAPDSEELDRQFVTALSQGRTLVQWGTAYTWKDGKVYKVVKGRRLAARGVDAIVDSVAPRASTRVDFHADSARMDDPSRARLDALGRAMSSEKLKDAVVMVIVVPPAETGAGRQNDREARLVAEYLASKHGIAPSRLKVPSAAQLPEEGAVEPEDADHNLLLVRVK